YRGERGAAGEFGHMIVGQRGHVACSCGNFDCWESFSSVRAAVAHYEKLTGGAKGGGRRLTLDDITERASGGEQAARAVLADMAHYLGVGISNLIVGLSPEAVVVGGHIARAWPLIGDSLGETIQRSVRRGLPSAHIVASALGNQPTLMGAISLVLARKFGLSKA
ncbi:MAG TPA: ROK family protein, partial [Pyrinomonadaceae bacterium]|nr:ROK family protein [Pyrinomonadaceae bacterium]